MSEQEKKPGVADYWSKATHHEQGKIREQMQPTPQLPHDVFYRMELTPDGITVWEKEQAIQFSCI